MSPTSPLSKIGDQVSFRYSPFPNCNQPDLYRGLLARVTPSFIEVHDCQLYQGKTPFGSWIAVFMGT